MTATGNVLRGIASLPAEQVLKNIDEWCETYPELVDTPMGRDLAQKREACAAAIAEKEVLEVYYAACNALP